MALDDPQSRAKPAAPVDISILRIAQVGYGEVGTIFSAALRKAGVHSVTAYDIKAADSGWMNEARSRADRDGIELAAALADATTNADLVICAVTAASAKNAMRAIAQACPRGAFVLDVNSASPETKKSCGALVNAAGGRHVEAAVMGAVPPYGLRVPTLLGGPHAADALPMLTALGFAMEAGSPDYGVVSAIKLCRSVVMKGIEALAVESLLAARRYGVEEQVIASLVESYPGMNWDTQADYYWRRVFQHGQRRAEEMREAAATVREAGLAPDMAAATAEVQARIAKLRAQGTFEGLAKDAPWQALADRIPRDEP